MQSVDILNLLKRIVAHPLFLFVIGFIFFTVQYGLSQGVMLFVDQRTAMADGIVFLITLMLGILMLVIYQLFGRFIEQRTTHDVSRSGALREWSFGVLVGFAAMSLTIGAIALFGGYRITGFNGFMPLIGALPMATISGICEEIIFRGIMFRLIERWLGSWAALALSSLFFGLVHLGNDNATWLAGFAIALEAGILLGAVYMLTRRLWAAIGLHMAWNFAQGGVYGVAVSGFSFKGMLSANMSGSVLLTGGAFGAESSLAAMIICTMIGLFFLYRAYRSGQFIAPSWHRFKTGEAA